MTAADEVERGLSIGEHRFGVIHFHGRHIDAGGRVPRPWALPLCWHAPTVHQPEHTRTDEIWNGAVWLTATPVSRIITTQARDQVSCPECLEWLHA